MGEHEKERVLKCLRSWSLSYTHSGLERQDSATSEKMVQHFHQNLAVPTQQNEFATYDNLKIKWFQNLKCQKCESSLQNKISRKPCSRTYFASIFSNICSHISWSCCNWQICINWGRKRTCRSRTGNHRNRLSTCNQSYSGCGSALGDLFLLHS